MPTPSDDAAATFLLTSEHQTNRNSLAQTVSDTVMAEQVSHNVVDNSQSASAVAALADVAANQTNTQTADDGTNTDALKTANASESATTNAEATAANHSLGKAAEPSAGEATPRITDEQKLPNGVHEVVESDGSVGVSSDTEGQKKDGLHHHRTSSVKKPTTFSKVSVTKTFMAKTASPAPTVTKIGEKPSALGPMAPPVNAAKPRLVAKTGALQSTLKARTGSESVSGPDASKVWNKNRPVPPQPPKQFTDEELKQQYGIHLATRLQSDENGKESKWADIDDDEEDWAPETVVWMDGTKSAIPTGDAPAAQLEQKPAAQPTPAGEKPAEPAAKPSVAAKKPVESGPPKMILKPGIAAQQAKQQNNSAATTPSSEKPSLKAKSPAPAPSRSPWASLPPVEAVPLINPPVQQPPVHTLRMATQDARAYEDTALPLPAREIAADTFDRSWREGEGAPRELFNSASGRYEPAPEGRRSSVKPETLGRKPSVLQRLSHGGPAEPSTSFQTRTSNQMDGSWGRRRGSSVSQGSIPSARRMSVNKAPELQTAAEGDERRPSLVVGHDMRKDADKPTFSQQSAWDQQMPPKPETGATTEATETEDPVKVQERVMREKREEARKRRQEDEERERVEKDERLKARLAALEGAGKSRKEREAEAAAAAVAAPSSRPSPIANVQPNEAPKPQQAEAQAGSPAPKPSEVSAATGPVLEAQSEPASQEKLPAALPSKPQQSGLSTLQEPTVPSGDQRQARGHLSPRAAARAPLSQQSYKPATSAYSSPGDRKQQPYRSPLSNNDAFQGWGSSAPNGNVWSTPGLGNGIFDKSTNFAPMPMSQQTSLPLPPGMNRPSPNRISPPGFSQEASSPSLQQQQVAEQQPRTFPPPGIDARAESGWGVSKPTGVSPAPGLERHHPPGPIAPPSRAQPQPQAVQRPDTLSAWQSAATRLPQQYAAEAAAAERNKHQGVVPPPDNPIIKDTFRQTSANQRLGAPRRYEKTEHTIHDAQGSRASTALSPAPPSTQTQPNGPVPTASPLNHTWKQTTENTVRIPDGSLNPAHGGLPKKQPPIGPPHRQQQAPPAVQRPNVHYPTGPLLRVQTPVSNDHTPPPPETSTHPVFEGSHQPNVRLPPPPPRVKLPPGQLNDQGLSNAQGMPVMPYQRPVQVWGPAGAVRPIAQTEDWQARFNGLFNRTPIHTEVPPSPPRTPPKMQGPVLAVAASTRAVVDEQPHVGATVSLPRSPVKGSQPVAGVAVDNSFSVVSKPTMDNIFTEELSFGFLPKVRLPRGVTYDADIYSGGESQYNLLKMSANSKLVKAVDSQSSVEVPGRYNLIHFFHKHPQGIFVKIPGTRLNNRLVFAHRAQEGNGNGNGNGYRKGQRNFDRKGSGKFNKDIRGEKKGGGIPAKAS